MINDLTSIEPGLDNVVAAETRLCLVDGAAGRLVLRGHDLADLADWSFEAVLGLLWEDLAPAPTTGGDIRKALGAARRTVFARTEALLPATDTLSPVEALRLLLSSLADAEDTPHHVLAVAATPVFAAAIARRRAGKARA